VPKAVEITKEGVDAGAEVSAGAVCFGQERGRLLAVNGCLRGQRLFERPLAAGFDGAAPRPLPSPPRPQELSRRVTVAMQEAHSKSVAGMKDKMSGLAKSLGLPGLPGQQ
jgi:hypothetical protein